MAESDHPHHHHHTRIPQVEQPTTKSPSEEEQPVSPVIAPPPPPPTASPAPSPPVEKQGEKLQDSLSMAGKEKQARTIMGSSSSASSRPPGSSAGGKHPMYRGIRSRSGKWVSEIREPRKTTRIWLGTYPTPEMAAAAYDVAALALKGVDAVLNFPDRVSSYPVPASPSPQAIRSAASSAAMSMMRAAKAGRSGEEERINVNESAAGDHYHQGSSSPTDSSYHTNHVITNSGSDDDQFIDEDALFDMPNLLVDMAGGMLVSPPRINSPPSDNSTGDVSDAENLWGYF